MTLASVTRNLREQPEPAARSRQMIPGRMGLPPIDSRILVLVTRLKTFVPWAKSTKLGTLTIKPFSFGHDL